MQKPNTPSNETERLNALEALGLMYSPAEDRFDRITRLVSKVFHVQTALVSLVASNCQWFKSKTGLDANETPRDISFCGHAILSDDTLIVPDTLEDPRFADNPLVTGEPYIRFYAGHPISIPGGLKLGTLCLIDPKPRTFSEQDNDQLRDFVGWVESEILMPKLSQVQQDLIAELSVARRQALLDSLTSVWNREGIMQILRQEASRMERSKKPFAILLADIDLFKSINDNYGHPAGDQVIREISRVLRGSVREYDAVGRIGGEEFLVVLTDCHLEHARQIGEKIRNRVFNMEVETGGHKIKTTLSSGVVVHGGHGKADIEYLIAEADKLLYKAKRQGRNLCLGMDMPTSP